MCQHHTHIYMHICAGERGNAYIGLDVEAIANTIVCVCTYIHIYTHLCAGEPGNAYIGLDVEANANITVQDSIVEDVGWFGGVGVHFAAQTTGMDSCVCVCVCVCMYMYACMYVCMYARFYC